MYNGYLNLHWLVGDNTNKGWVVDGVSRTGLATVGLIQAFYAEDDKAYEELGMFSNLGEGVGMVIDEVAGNEHNEVKNALGFANDIASLTNLPSKIMVTTQLSTKLVNISSKQFSKALTALDYGIYGSDVIYIAKGGG